MALLFLSRPREPPHSAACFACVERPTTSNMPRPPDSKAGNHHNTPQGIHPSCAVFATPGSDQPTPSPIIPGDPTLYPSLSRGSQHQQGCSVRAPPGSRNLPQAPVPGGPTLSQARDRHTPGHTPSRAVCVQPKTAYRRSPPLGSFPVLRLCIRVGARGHRLSAARPPPGSPQASARRSAGRSRHPPACHLTFQQ